MNYYYLAALSLLTHPLVCSSNAAACPCSPLEIAEAYDSVFAEIYAKAAPAVVYIKCEGSSVDMDDPNNPYNYPNPFDYFGDDFLRRFFGFQGGSRMMPKPSPSVSQGSGFFISPDGYIVTNAHVVQGADKITVSLEDGREIDARLVGEDPDTDIAVIKAEGKDFPFLTYGDSDKALIGNKVIAIGSPFQLKGSMCDGRISGKSRQNLRIIPTEDFIQTTADINPGNSGGPLLNLQGEVIGVNAAIMSKSGGSMGIAFSIPSNLAQKISSQLIQKGSVAHGFMGVSLQPVDKDIAEAFGLDKMEGVLVTDVVKDSPADKAGLKQGDIILAYNNTPVKSFGSFRNEVSLMQPGSSMKLKVNRKGQILTLDVVIGNAEDKVASSQAAMQKFGFEVDTLNPAMAQQLGLNPNEPGVVITKIRPGSPAAMSGLRPGFLIQAVNHKSVSNIAEFNEAMRSNPNKNRMLLLIRQGSVTRFYTIKLD